MKKSPFDTSAFTFSTSVEDLEKALGTCTEELLDLLEYRVPDSEQKKRIHELTYWLVVWETELPRIKAEGLTSVDTCAIENRVLGLYTGKKGKKKK